MNDNIPNLEIEELEPTFLFTWKGTRTVTEEKYHNHENLLELAFIMSGEGKYHIDDKIYDVSEGDLLIFNPGVYHQAIFVEGTPVPATEFFIGFADVQLKNQPRNFFPLPGEGNILHTTGELRQKIFKICTSMDMERSAHKQGRYYMMKSYLVQILILVIRELSRPVEFLGGYAFESTNKKYVVEQILNYFEDHYSEKVSLDTIAENMYLSPFYISKIFKTETGDAPIRHLINIRLEKAREILEQGGYSSIQEVASMVGYEDAFHFSKLFKKHFGISPSQVKKVP